jgi:hypothetical protein
MDMPRGVVGYIHSLLAPTLDELSTSRPGYFNTQEDDTDTH